MRETGGSIWTYLVAAFIAVAMAVVVLPGCGDDASDDEDETQYESESDYSPQTS